MGGCFSGDFERMIRVGLAQGKINHRPKFGLLKFFVCDQEKVQATRKVFLRAEARAISRPTPYLPAYSPSCGAHQRTMPTQ